MLTRSTRIGIQIRQLTFYRVNGHFNKILDLGTSVLLVAESYMLIIIFFELLVWPHEVVSLRELVAPVNFMS